MRADVLGPLRLQVADDDVALPSGHVGHLLQILLLRPNTRRTSEELVASLWAGTEPDGPARRRLQVVVSRLRRFLASSGNGSAWTVLGSGGEYELAVAVADIDRLAFEEWGHAALESNDAELASKALGLWRGDPYEGFPSSPALHEEVASLRELRNALVALVGDKADQRDRPGRSVGPEVERTRVSSAPAVGDVRVLACIAPAGFGKSTFLAQWASKQTRPVAWVNLESEYEDASRLWTALGRALHDVLPTAQSDEARSGSSAMLEMLSVQDAQFGLVLDDLHALTDPVAHAEIAKLISALPTGCTVAIGSRDELPAEFLPTRPFVLTDVDLRFDVDEIHALIGGDRSRAIALRAATDGWPIAVTALHRSGADIPSTAPAAFERYIETEVLDNLPAEVRRLVLVISHLDAFTLDLCETLADEGDVSGALSWLRDHGLFVVEIGSAGRRGWTRLHPLVASAARRRAVTEVNSMDIWRRAAQWHMDHGMLEESLRYALMAGDRRRISALAGDVLIDSALRGEGVRCVKWLRQIVPEDLLGDVQAHAIAVYLAVEWMKPDERDPWLRSRERHFADPDDAVWTLVNAIAATREGRSSQGIELSELVVHRCLEGSWPDVGEFNTLLLGSAFSNLLRAKVFQGDIRHDDPLFPSAISLIRPRAPLLAAWVHSFWGFVAVADGNFELAEVQADAFFQVRRLKELGRPVRDDNSMVGATVAAARTSDVGRLRAIASGIADLPELFDSNGSYTEATVARLVLAAIHARAGDDETAELLDAQAAIAMSTFPDARFLERFRNRMKLIGSRQRPTKSAASFEALTPKQRAIAELLRTELSLEEIADRLFISRHTLRTHLRNMYLRLDVHTRAEAASRIDALSPRFRR